MRNAVLAGSLILLSLASPAQTDTLAPGAALLFQNTKSSLTMAEKNRVFSQLGFLLSADQKQFIAGKEGADFPFDAFVYPIDLNKDGREEVFIRYGNSYTSGSTGSSIILFMKNAAGKYTPQLGFPGTLPDVIITAGNHYPDLVIGGPGFEFPVWKWKTNAYDFSRKIKEADLKKLKTETIENLSREYTASLK